MRKVSAFFLILGFLLVIIGVILAKYNYASEIVFIFANFMFVISFIIFVCRKKTITFLISAMLIDSALLNYWLTRNDVYSYIMIVFACVLILFACISLYRQKEQ